MPLTRADIADPRAYVRLAAIVRQQIIDGTLEPGQPVPSITRLSQEHGHARATCGKALRTLEDGGLLTRIPGLGYYVNGGPAPTG
jgi:DNA-binding GntR family transcriptional regulator